MNFIEQYNAARRVSTPLVAVRTFDARATLNHIRGSLGETVKDNPLLLWDAVAGLTPLVPSSVQELGRLLSGTEQGSTVDLATTLALLEGVSRDVTVFISNAHLQWSQNEPAIIQGIWNLRDTFKTDGNMLVLLCSPGARVPSELTNDVIVIDDPLPTVEEIQDCVRNTYNYANLPEPDANTLERATDALIGLPAFAAEQATAICLNVTKDGDGAPTGALDLKELWEHKRQTIAQTPGLSVWRGNDSLEDVGGLDQVKQFMRDFMQGNEPPKVIIFIDEIEKAMAGSGTDMSGVKSEMMGTMLSWMQDKDMDGMIFIGLPGVSKSQLAKSAGGTFGKPVINFDIAGMQSGIIGSSGTNLRTAQKTVDAISGGRVLCIATCNSIHALPPELRRRFALGTFFFDAPTKPEREAIWKIWRGKFGLSSDEPNPADDGWTGAEIKECCMKSYRLRVPLSTAAQYIVPITRSSADLVNNMRLSCSGKYLSASKPGVYVFEGDTAVQMQQAAPATPVRGRVFRTEK